MSAEGTTIQCPMGNTVKSMDSEKFMAQLEKQRKESSWQMPKLFSALGASLDMIGGPSTHYDLAASNDGDDVYTFEQNLEANLADAFGAIGLSAGEKDFISPEPQHGSDEDEDSQHGHDDEKHESGGEDSDIVATNENVTAIEDDWCVCDGTSTSKSYEIQPGFGSADLFPNEPTQNKSSSWHAYGRSMISFSKKALVLGATGLSKGHKSLKSMMSSSNTSQPVSMEELAPAELDLDDVDCKSEVDIGLDCFDDEHESANNSVHDDNMDDGTSPYAIE